MKNFKEKLYDYNAEPPAELWNNINAELDKNAGNVFSLRRLRKRSKLIFYGLTAAASLIIIFLSSLFFNSGGNQEPNSSASITAIRNDNLTAKKIHDSIQLNNKILEDIIKSPKDDKMVAPNYENALSKVKKYITIAGPEGQPVKISPKVATLIVSADNEYPPKTIWDKKIDKWKQIMLVSTLSPTSTSLIDIAQFTSAVDNNE
ncbi:MAG: hypothetical protein ABI261_07475 [Ginsengibacter sp.]